MRQSPKMPDVPPVLPGPPADLLPVAEAAPAPLAGLAPGSREAQEAQLTAAAELGLPLEVKTVQTGIILRLVPAGAFTMGSPPDEQEAVVRAGLKRDWVEGERERRVTLTKGFYCGKYEVTQGQWEAVMGSNPSHFAKAGKDAPVEYVSWEDCLAFLARLCELEGVAEGTYRLMTEAEWEYACRAGTSMALYTGGLTIAGAKNSLELDPIAWYGGNSGVAYEGACDVSGWPEKQQNHTRAGTLPVGGKLPNAFGLHDMIGNVWEWCGDWQGTAPSGPVTDPTGPAEGTSRVCCGGGWYDDAGHCRAAFRYRDRPGFRNRGLGCRLARTIP